MSMPSISEDHKKREIDIAVIGGGASGMAAAVFAQRTFLEKQGKPGHIVIMERNDRVGKKLLMTGNGRCNLTNLDDELYHYHGGDTRFAKGALLRYPPPAVISFFDEIGVVCTVDESQKVYPLSLHAASILDSLRLCLSELGVEIRTGVQVVGLSRDQHGFTLEMADHTEVRAAAVIAAAGGMCAPSTGSDGNGYKLLTPFSHKLLVPVPSIVQLRTDTKFCKPLSGNKIQGSAALYISGKKIREEQGEILFTDYGLSGPPILQLSGYVSRALSDKSSQSKNASIQIFLDFLTDRTPDEVLTMMFMRRESFMERKLEEFLTGLFHRRLALGLLREATDKSMSALVSSLTDSEITKLSAVCKALPVRVTGTMPFANAQTTAGGISTNDFDPSTLASAKCPGLFAAGEILDIDGDCGGYNLQWAWSSGFLAGNSAAQYIIKERSI